MHYNIEVGAGITELFHTGLSTFKEHLCTRIKESYVQYLGHFTFEQAIKAHARR
jgi:hypothetical protein